jgi:hypothetical protein
MSEIKILLLRRSTLAVQAVRFLMVLFCAALVGCSSATEERGAANIRAVNHTKGAINWMKVNGYGVDGGGGRTCCIGLPLRWRPGLVAEIEWEVDPDPFAEIKRRPLEEGAGFDKDAFAEHAAKYKRFKKTVPIPEWPGTKSCEFNVHFLTCNRVRVMTACLTIHHPDYPIKDGYSLKEPDVCQK